MEYLIMGDYLTLRLLRVLINVIVENHFISAVLALVSHETNLAVFLGLCRNKKICCFDAMKSQIPRFWASEPRICFIIPHRFCDDSFDIYLSPLWLSTNHDTYANVTSAMLRLPGLRGLVEKLPGGNHILFLFREVFLVISLIFTMTIDWKFRHSECQHTTVHPKLCPPFFQKSSVDFVNFQASNWSMHIRACRN